MPTYEELNERVERLEAALLEPVTVKLRRLPHCLSEEPPVRASAGAAGADVRAAISNPILLPEATRVVIPTGLEVADVPAGYEIQVRPRSGLAARNGITVLNAPGTIDEDYRGEIKVILINHGNESFTIEPNERIGQLVIARRVGGSFEWTQSSTETERGDKGLGSTGRS